LTLDGERQIKEVAEGNTYRYLRIAQVFGSDAPTIKHWLRWKFIGKLRVIWSLKLNAKQKVVSINSSVQILLWNTKMGLDATVRQNLSKY